MTQTAAPYDVVRQCAELREQQEKEAQKPMTIPEAIARAQWMQRTPDGFAEPMTMRKTIIALLAALEASPCYFKAVQKGEEVFVLRQSDRAAPFVIQHWAALADDHGCKPEKVIDAQAIASRWIALDLATTKWPD